MNLHQDDVELSPSQARAAFEDLFKGLTDKIRNREILTAVKTVSCSWCHEAVALTRQNKQQTCPNCGHRADVARVSCDCGVCLSTRRGA